MEEVPMILLVINGLVFTKADDNDKSLVLGQLIVF
jgi:hypothetical protein